jgi:mycothiol system anti-sigma-R factor
VTCDEAQELITALVDGELADAERASLEKHLEECPRCRHAVEEERSLSRTVRARAQSVRAPAHLRDRVLADPRIFPEKSQSVRRRQDYSLRRPHLLGPALAAALLLAIALPMYWMLKPGSEPIAAIALETYELFLRGDLSIDRTENPDELVEHLTRAVGGRFHPMGYDFTALQLRPVAGFVREIEGRKILVAVYQGQGGSLFCYTFLGSEEDAPTDASRFHDVAKKMNFYAFSRGRINAVFHREGDIICVLASEMPLEELLALARSKAKTS